MTEILTAWETKKVTMSTANHPYKICVLRGGDSVTIKAGAVSPQYHLLCTDDNFSPDKVYRLDAGESVTISLTAAYGRRNRIIIWGESSSGSDIVWLIKISGIEPETAGRAT